LQHKEVAKNEIDILKDLNHPQVVSYYGAAMKQDLIVVFLEYMSGSSLLQNLKQRGPLAEESAIRCSFQTAQGLAYIHDKDIVHIDIKCELHLCRVSFFKISLIPSNISTFQPSYFL
jgi:serine/threonine protein kinase